MPHPSLWRQLLLGAAVLVAVVACVVLTSQRALPVVLANAGVTSSPSVTHGTAASGTSGTSGDSADGDAAQAAAVEPTWVGSWAAAMERPYAAGVSATGFAQQTVRQNAVLSLGGSKVRVRLSNAFGTSDLVVAAGTVALGGPGAATATAPVRLTWNGQPSVRISSGTERLSDPVAITVPDGSTLTVSTFLPGPTGPVTWRAHGWAPAYAAAGNVVGDASGNGFTATTAPNVFLDAVDVLTPSAGAVVAFGDSITVGCCGDVRPDQYARFPDTLAARLAELPASGRMGVLNLGISGNRLIDTGAGQSALARFDRDVLGRTGVRTVILLEGINDIGHGRGGLDPQSVIAVYRQFIERGHAAGLRVVGATLTPYAGSEYSTVAGEQQRQQVNDWIRSSGEFDGVIDFDAMVRDPANPSRMQAAYDPGDHLHPNPAAQRAMGAAIPLSVLR